MPDSGGKTITRMFESGDSQTLRIPRELAYDESVQEVEIERKGDMLLIRPIHRKKLTGIGAVFSMFSPDFMAGGRELDE